MATNRNCGGCTACCWTHYITELKKPMLTRCPHQCDKGCAIYGEHPIECKLYLCGWRRGRGQEWHRPDLSGIVIDEAVESGHPRITLVETRSGAFESASGQLIMSFYKQRRIRFRTISFAGEHTRYIPRADGELLDLIRDSLGCKSESRNEVVYDT